jgi:hypothetical protein
MAKNTTVRERMMKVYRNQVPDRSPVAIYARYLPRGSSERVVRNLGLGIIDYYPIVSMLAPPWHTHSGYLSQVQGADLDITFTWENGQAVEIRTYHTPLGSLTQRTRKDPAYASDWIDKFYISRMEDYKIMQYLVENTLFRSNRQGFQARQQDLGDDGVLLARVDRSPFQKLLIELAGPERFLVDLQIEPEPVLELLGALDRRMDEVFARVCESEAEVIWQPDNISCDMTPPALFEKFCLPYYSKHSQRLHERQKVFLVHMDGRLRAIKKLIAQCPIDGIESFSLPVIGGDLTLAEAQTAWPGKVVLPNFPSSLATQDDGAITAFLEEVLGNFGSHAPSMLQVSEDIPPGTWQHLLPLICKQFGGELDSAVSAITDPAGTRVE